LYLSTTRQASSPSSASRIRYPSDRRARTVIDRDEHRLAPPDRAVIARDGRAQRHAEPGVGRAEPIDEPGRTQLPDGDRRQSGAKRQPEDHAPHPHSTPACRVNDTAAPPSSRKRHTRFRRSCVNALRSLAVALASTSGFSVPRAVHRWTARRRGQPGRRSRSRWA
jgi:hypothetical protein